MAVFPASLHGVTIAATCSDYIVTNNRLSGNTGSSLNDAGTAPKKIAAPNLT